jgi:hypothetical protein
MAFFRKTEQAAFHNSTVEAHSLGLVSLYSHPKVSRCAVDSASLNHVSGLE